MSATSSNAASEHNPPSTSKTNSTVNMDFDNIICTRVLGSNSPKSPGSHEDTSPMAKRQRITRADISGRKRIDYDMKYHPMDDVLRPKAAAKRRSCDQPPQQLPNEGRNGKGAVEDPGFEGSKLTNQSDNQAMIIPKYRRITRAETLGEKSVDYDMKYHPMDDVLRPKAAAKRRSCDQQPHYAADDKNQESADEDLNLDTSTSTDPLFNNRMMITPQRHRVTRAETLGGKAVDYDMKYHPIDDVLRPKAAAKRSACFKSVSPPPISQKAAKATNTISIGKNDPKNPFTKPTPENWKELRAFDRRVYLLQKGSPINGNTLPLKWSKVADALIEDDFFTRREFKTWGGVEVLKERYENLRVGFEGFFGAKPEPVSKMGWQVVHAEGFDFFEDSQESVVPPPSVRDRKESREERADSKDDDEEDDHPEIGDSYDLRMTDASENKMDSSTELSMRGGNAASTFLHHTRAPSETSLISYHNAEQFLQAENHLMESMRSQPSSDIGPMMADDELDAVLGEMASPAPVAELTSTMRVPSSSLSDSVSSLTEPCQKSPQTPAKPNVAKMSKILKNSEKFPAINEARTFGPASSGFVPPSILKAARRIEQQNTQKQPSKQPSPRPSAPASPSKTSDPDIATKSMTTRKTPRKVYKRGPRVKSSSAEFQVHEDQPGNTPLIKKQIALHPKSPGTDIKKENIDHHSLVEAEITAAHRRLQNAITRSPSTVRRSGVAVVIPGTSIFEQGSTAPIQSYPGFVVADGRAAGIDRMGPGAFVAPLTPRSARIRRV